MSADFSTMNEVTESNQQQIEQILSQFKLSDGQLTIIRDKILEGVKKGLKRSSNKKCIAMLPTFVKSVPNGTEFGDFLALDLGGTNFRVVRVQLPGSSGGKVIVHNQVFKTPQHIMVGTGEQLFDHIAECIADFLKQHDLQDQRLPLGFTFSFPCKQEGLNKSSLLRWTKGFNASGVVGEDIVQLLQDAVHRLNAKGVKCEVDVVAVINDTVGTLMSCAYDDHNCSIGMVVGTGTNACYMESTSNIEYLDKTSRRKSPAEFLPSSRDEMCINTEWGGFGEDGSLEEIRTVFDHIVDEISINPNCMIYEKMISGLYLGDVVQQILIHLIRASLLFDGVLSEEIEKYHSFLSSFLTQIESDRSSDLSMCKQILKNLGYSSTTLCQRQVVRDVCVTVSTRAAHLCSAGVSALVDRLRTIRQDSSNSLFQVTVAVDGTLYKKHPTFKHILNEKVHDLSPHSLVTFRLSHDGSGKGAALVSAVACRLLRNHGQ